MIRALLVFAAALALAGVAFWLVVGARQGVAPAGVAVIGDRAPDILEALGTGQTLPIRSAALTVVAVDGWQRLDYVSDMQALCGAACTAPAAMVRAVSLRPGGSRKVLLMDLSAGPRAGEEPDFACLAQVIAREERSLRGRGPLPDCAPPAMAEARTLWVLPFGLGRL